MSGHVLRLRARQVYVSLEFGSLYRRLACQRKKRGALVGKTRRGKATKLMAVADRHGLPIACGIAIDARLKRRGVEMIAPNKRTRARTQDGRQLRRYRRRWHVERLFAWLLRFRRLVTRYEYKAENFLGFLQLACALILLRKL